MPKQEILILVDDNDNEIGTDTRENCHSGNGKRHRAYTAFVFHDGKLLLQQRSKKKLLWPGAWDVSFTSHVYPGESYQQAAKRRAFVCADAVAAANATTVAARSREDGMLNDRPRAAVRPDAGERSAG